ncbi:MAG: DUF4870 domain-containing protein [Candidatus Omnitrophica bacterium]|nr:DUF4870 domain-containing protein [Candidatus Omnitrophota bacterium]
MGKTSTGIQPNVAALLSYVLGVLTGVIFLIIEKENKFVRFHAMQSIITFGGLFVIQIVFAFIPVVGAIIIPIISIASLILWVVLMIKSYQGEKFKLPIVGDMAEKQA